MKNYDGNNDGNRPLIYWLLFEIYDYPENVSRQTINKKICLHFTDKTDKDVDNAINFLNENNLITIVDNEKGIVRITPQGGQAIQKLFQQIILDQTDLEFFRRYNNGVEANYVKIYQRETSDEKDSTTKKLRAALKNIKEFLMYLDSIRKFSPHIKDLFEIVSDLIKHTN